MKFSRKRLSARINTEIRSRMPEVRQEHLEETIAQTKALYERQGRRDRIGFGGLLLRQIRFIGWKVWLMQLVLLIVIIRIIGFAFIVSGSGRHISYFLCGSGILTVWAAVPVIERSIRYKMYEIENTTLFSGGRLMTARFVIVFSGILVMVIAMMCLMTVRYMYSFSEVVFSFILPLMAAASLFLYLFRRLKAESVLKGCNLAGGISIVAILFLDRGSGYNPMDIPLAAGWMVCALCLTLSIIQVRKIWERESCEKIPEFNS